MTTPLTICPAIISESLEDVEEEDTTDYDSVYNSHAYSSSFPPSSEHLYPLQETDHGDSAYSSDSSSSPTFTDGYSSLVVPPLCHSTIPEEQHQQKQTQKQANTTVVVPSSRRRRSKGQHLSVDMEETLRSLHHQQPNRALRRTSLVLDDARYIEDASQQLQDILRPMAESQRPLVEEGGIRDSDVDSGVSCHDCEESRVENQRLCHSDSYDGGDAASVVSWDDYADLSAGRRPSLTQYDPSSLTSVAKPWEKLCNGSVSRAMNQLHVKKVTHNPDTHNGNADFRGSKGDLRECRNNHHHSSKSDLRMSKGEMRASKSDLRALMKAELRASKSDLRASKQDLRASRQDLRGSKQDLRASRSDLRASKSDLRSSKSDLRASKSDLRASKSDLRASKTDLRVLQRSNLTLSRLDLAHETLDDKCLREDEGEDIIRCDLTLPRRKNVNRTDLAPFMRGNSLHMSFRVPKRRDMQI